MPHSSPASSLERLAVDRLTACQLHQIPFPCGVTIPFLPVSVSTPGISKCRKETTSLSSDNMQTTDTQNCLPDYRKNPHLQIYRPFSYVGLIADACLGCRREETGTGHALPSRSPVDVTLEECGLQAPKQDTTRNKIVLHATFLSERDWNTVPGVRDEGKRQYFA